MTIHLHDVLVGRPRAYPIPGADDPATETFTTAIAKVAVAGRIALGRSGLDGDQVHHTSVHGGPDQALLAYPRAHYAAWRAEGASEGALPGSFGENLAVSGATEDEVCVGDRWRIGDVVLEVTKPRTPCRTLAWHHRDESLRQRVFDTGRSGWYLRVLAGDWLEAGRDVEIVARPHPDWSVRRAALAMASRQERPEEAALLAAVPALAEDWRYRIARGK